MLGRGWVELGSEAAGDAQVVADVAGEDVETGLE